MFSGNEPFIAQKLRERLSGNRVGRVVGMLVARIDPQFRTVVSGEGGQEVEHGNAELAGDLTYRPVRAFKRIVG